MKSFSEYLHSSYLIEKKHTTPCDEIFQELIFGLKKGKGRKSYEADTKAEVGVKWGVMDYIMGTPASSGVLNAFKRLKGCAAQYPDALRPNITHAWRGIGFSPASNGFRVLPMKALLKSTERLQIGRTTYVGAPGIYTNKRTLESWSAEPHVADKFANNYAMDIPRGEIKILDSEIRTAKKMMAGKSIDMGQWNDIVDGIAYEFNMASYTLLNADISAVYNMKVDGDFIFAEWFANTLSMSGGWGAESEATRVVSTKKTAKAMVYVAEKYIDAINLYNQYVQELRDIMGAKMPKKIKEMSFK